MTYVLPPDLYEDWKELYFTKELTENIVKQLKEQTVKGTENENHKEIH